MCAYCALDPGFNYFIKIVQEYILTTHTLLLAVKDNFAKDLAFRCPHAKGDKQLLGHLEWESEGR